MKAWKLLFLVPVVAAIAMVPQDPQAEPTPVDQVAVATICELRYLTRQGTPVVVPARSVVEIRFFDEESDHIRIELLYENGDYSMLDVDGFHLIRGGNSSREVRLVRSKQARMRFPRLP